LSTIGASELLGIQSGGKNRRRETAQEEEVGFPLCKKNVGGHAIKERFKELAEGLRASRKGARARGGK